jgi:glycosyltransferase involved in cell wall biosynthesis
MRGNRSVRFLGDITTCLPSPPPKVSVIVAARNEERNIREALLSLLRLQYPNYELIVVDDRSDDATGAIVDELAGHDPRFQAVHVTELPPGWLGKTHALWSGSRRATGELFLFTDADIVMEPTVLSRAVHYLREQRIDHLAVTPVMRMPSLFLAMFGASFIIFFSLFARPWKARDPKSPCHIGIGAFNLVTADAYRTVGGHEAIRLRPDDDMKLGKIVKKGGYRQDIVYGRGFLDVEWYSSVREVIHGLEKNAFSGTDYRVGYALWGALFYLLCGVWPWLALLATTGATRMLNGAVVLLVTLIFADTARFHGARPWHGVGFPLCAGLFSWIIVRTLVLNLVRGGITWRGTFYPLKELRRNRV